MEIKQELEADGVEFFIYSDVHELFPGVWITGPIDRIHNEKKYGGNWKIITENGVVEDNIPEDQSLIIDKATNHQNILAAIKQSLGGDYVWEKKLLHHCDLFLWLFILYNWSLLHVSMMTGF